MRLTIFPIRVRPVPLGGPVGAEVEVEVVGEWSAERLIDHLLVPLFGWPRGVYFLARPGGPCVQRDKALIDRALAMRPGELWELRESLCSRRRG